jgi:hypothetical protein
MYLGGYNILECQFRLATKWRWLLGEKKKVFNKAHITCILHSHQLKENYINNSKP